MKALVEFEGVCYIFKSTDIGCRNCDAADTGLCDATSKSKGKKALCHVLYRHCTELKEGQGVFKRVMI